MPLPQRTLPQRANLEHLKNEAKRRLKALRRTDPDARLATAQRDLAREYGFPSWRRLKDHVESARATKDLPRPWSESLFVEVAAALRRSDTEGAERIILDMRERYPGDEELQAYLADFALNQRKDAASARAIYDRLLTRPNTNILTHYASFLESSGNPDPDELEALYRRAVAMGTGDAEELAFALNNYAGFLLHRRKDRAGADRLLRRAAEMDYAYPRIKAVHLGFYGRFLWEEHGDAEQAAECFRQARALSREDGLMALDFAILLTATGRVEEGLALIPEVLASWSLTAVYDPVPIELVCWFLVYAHGPEARRAEALHHLKARLRSPSGERRAGTDLRRNAEAAVREGHPAPALLRALTDLLSGRTIPTADALAALHRCPAWAAEG